LTKAKKYDIIGAYIFYSLKSKSAQGEAKNVSRVQNLLGL
jgi:hypothetical protein